MERLLDGTRKSWLPAAWSPSGCRESSNPRVINPHPQGFNRLYNYNLASSLKRIFMKHQPLWRGYEGPGQPGAVPGVKTIREFDEAITVHSFGASPPPPSGLRRLSQSLRLTTT